MLENFETFGQLILKYVILKESLQFMSLLSGEFDRIAFLFTNKEDMRGKIGQHNNLLMKKSSMTCNI